MDQYQCRPRGILADMACSHPIFERFYRFHGIRFYSTGPRTPWPNRAETAIRLFKRQYQLLTQFLQEDPTIPNPTLEQVVQKCVWARNNQLTVSGKTLLELVFGRRLLPFMDFETLDPAALSEDPLAEDLTNMQIQRLAIRAHLEAKQLQDLRRDIARNLRPSDGPYSPGEKIFFWEKDHSKIKDTGRWVRGRVLGQPGSMVTIETDKAVVRINQSKVRRDKDIWHDISLPRELEEDSSTQGHQGPPSRTHQQPLSLENPPSRINPPVEGAGGSSRDSGDYWRDDGHSWTRIHVVPRRAFFTPDGSPGCPTEEQIQQRRISRVVFKDNTRQRIENDWKETGPTELEHH